MSALQPMALLWLLLAVPAILLLYLLKPKRREHLISSVLLWDRLLKDTQARTPFQKLRRSLLLLLQLLLVVLLAMALSRPFVRVHALGGQSMAIVIDESASMRSTDVPESRFEEARRVARRMIDGMGQSDRAVLILAGARPRGLPPHRR
ncbi:MAG: VWA domain-containing protein [Armatimonadetes bacterium]|nr:VWA domain-containing protein [Armatimonadota bacterium]